MGWGGDVRRLDWGGVGRGCKEAGLGWGGEGM